jgi:hypothetical protein
MRRARPLPERHPKEMSRFSVSMRVISVVALRAEEITVFMMMLRNVRMMFKSERGVKLEERASIRT